MHKLLLFLHKLRTLGVAILMLASFFAALAFAWQGIAVAESVREKLATALDLTRRAMEVKFLVADFNGWQTAYAFDIVRGTPDATEDDARVRAKFLASAAAFRDKLRTMKEEPSIPDEHPDLETLEKAFQQFMDIDGTVIAAYRGGGTVAVQHANELVLGRELEIFEEAHTRDHAPHRLDRGARGPGIPGSVCGRLPRSLVVRRSGRCDFPAGDLVRAGIDPIAGAAGQSVGPYRRHDV